MNKHHHQWDKDGNCFGCAVQRDNSEVDEFLRDAAREAPPAGEPTPDTRKLANRAHEVMSRWMDTTIDSAEAIAMLRRLLAAQPAPASPPRDESPLRSRLEKLAAAWEESARWIDTKAGGVWQQAAYELCEALDLPCAPTVPREVDEAASTNAAIIRAHELLTNRGVHPGIVGERNSIARLHERIEDHVQPSRRVQYEVDEAADDRYRLAIDLPEDVYPPERWVTEVNKTCADLGLAECRIVAVGVDEAAVRASLAGEFADWLASRGHGVAGECLRSRFARTTVHPAASGKDGAT